jgi:hypothetical protein
MTLQENISVRFAFTVIALFLFTLSIKACKDDTEVASETATVDNYANSSRSGFTLNQCGDANASVNSLSDSDLAKMIDSVKAGDAFANGSNKKIEDAIKSVLKVTPKFIYEPFFASKAKIYVNEGEIEKCLENEAEVGVAKNFACWSSKPDANGLYFGAGARFDENEKEKDVSAEEAIRHGMLRLMAYHTYGPILSSPSSNLPEELKQLTSSDKTNILQIMLEGFKEDLKLHGTDVALKKDSEDELRLKLFIETIDSRYCSETTHNKFKSCFPNLYHAFDTGKASEKSLSLSSCTK